MTADIDLRREGPGAVIPTSSVPNRRHGYRGFRESNFAQTHIGDDAIVLRTGKSRQRREAIIPLYDDLRAVLERNPRRATRS